MRRVPWSRWPQPKLHCSEFNRDAQDRQNSRRSNAHVHNPTLSCPSCLSLSTSHHLTPNTQGSRWLQPKLHCSELNRDAQDRISTQRTITSTKRSYPVHPVYPCSFSVASRDATRAMKKLLIQSSESCIQHLTHLRATRRCDSLTLEHLLTPPRSGSDRGTPRASRPTPGSSPARSTWS